MAGYRCPGADTGFMECIAQAALIDAIEREQEARTAEVGECLYLDDREARAAWYAEQEEVQR